MLFTGHVFSSTDGWTSCALGHQHWGRAGAAGLFLHRDGAHGPEVLLQHRALWSHHGGTWGTPGGALHAGEEAHVGALRECREELGLTPDDVVLGALSVDDHGGWAYTTVLARPARPFEATVHIDRYDDTGLEQAVDGYDRRRDARHSIKDRQRDPARFGVAEFYGWSEDKARQAAVPEGAGFATWLIPEGLAPERYTVHQGTALQRRGR